MKVRTNNKINMHGLTQENVLNFFVSGHVSDDWYEKIDCILEKLKINGSWTWPNAQLVITKTGVDEFAVRSIT